MATETTLKNRFVWVDGDIYQITGRVSGREYLARFHAGYGAEDMAEESEPEEAIRITSGYRGDASLWPFDGDTLTGVRV